MYDDPFGPYQRLRSPFAPPEGDLGGGMDAVPTYGDFSSRPSAPQSMSWGGQAPQFQDPGLDASVAEGRSEMDEGEQRGLAAGAAIMAQDQQQQGQMQAQNAQADQQRIDAYNKKKQQGQQSQGGDFQWGGGPSDKSGWGSM